MRARKLAHEIVEMAKSKQRSEQHLIDAAGEQLLGARLPPHWVLRTYRPDYGLDFSLEVFQESTNSPGEPATYETLGEHLFIQLKSTETVTRGPLKVSVEEMWKKRVNI